MIQFLYKPEVIYPISVCLVALWMTFFNRKINLSDWPRLMGGGFALTLCAIGGTVLFGLPLKGIPSVLTFHGGALSGLRLFVALGYMLILAGFLLMLRSLVSQKR